MQAYHRILTPLCACLAIPLSISYLPRSAAASEPQRTDASDTEKSSAETGPLGWTGTREIVEAPTVSVQTTIGKLPRLPLKVAVNYRDGLSGPKVRVIWPAPDDNAAVSQVGSYRVTGRIPGSAVEPQAIVTVIPTPATGSLRPERLIEPFALGAVVLNQDLEGRDTLFIRNRDKFLEGLMQTNPDRFLFMFRDAFGQPQPDGADPLRGWDSRETRLRGHTTGHYLSALAQAYASTTFDQSMQAEFERKMNYVVDTLYDLALKSGRPVEANGPATADPSKVPPGPGKDEYDSDLSVDGIRTDYWNWGRGFISAYPPDQFIMLEQGATYGGGNHQVWAPYYTLHKILAGLCDCYELGGSEKALEVAQGMGIWVYERLRRLQPEARIRMWNRYIAGEYGGMNEVLARLFRLTNDERMLECAKLFDNIEFFFGDADRSHGLASNVDTIRGKHANQHIPQITGALEVYRCMRAPQYYDVAENFWHLCTGSYMYSIGGVAGASNPDNAECFTAEPDSLYANGFARGGQNETCATYNLLKLSRQLFMFRPDGKYMDYYEQALMNHILASVAEDNAGNTYHVPLNPGSRKQFGNASMRGFTCCNGTALESNTKLQDSIYFKSTDDQTLYVNLFVSSTLHWDKHNVLVRQETNFPYSDRSRLTIEGTAEFAIAIRHPTWATEGLQVSINGEQLTLDTSPGQYFSVRRRWSPGDSIELQVPFRFRLSRLMDQPNIASIFYGPVLLAVEEKERLSEWRRVSLGTEDLEESIAGDPSTLRFRLGDLRLKPFFESYGRYSVYLDVIPQ